MGAVARAKNRAWLLGMLFALVTLGLWTPTALADEYEATDTATPAGASMAEDGGGTEAAPPVTDTKKAASPDALADEGARDRVRKPAAPESETPAVGVDPDEDAQAETPGATDDDLITGETDAADGETTPDEQAASPDETDEPTDGADSPTDENETAPDAEAPAPQATTPTAPELPGYAGWYSAPDSSIYYYDAGVAHAGWLVTPTQPNGAVGGLERYWLDPLTRQLVRAQLIDVGDGTYAYARPEGYVVRGKYRAADGTWYLADNDGRLARPGWLVTALYDGELQRYYIDPEVRGARPGTSTAGGWRHYTRPDAGYVARGKHLLADGRVLLADNEGKLAQAGWLVTALFDGHLERYYVDSDGAAQTGYFLVAAKPYYGVPGQGFVVRGKYAYYQGAYRSIILADNDGVMAAGEGWLVTALFDGHLERYRLDYGDGARNPFVTARTGWFALGGHDYYGLPNDGFVVRGFYIMPDNSVIIANNDGWVGRDPAGIVLSQTNWLPDGLDANYAVSGEAMARISQAINEFARRGYALGFVLVDLASGNRVSYGANTTIYAASTMKASYCTWILSQLVDTGRVPLGAVADRIERVIRYSDNDAYISLRNTFGAGEFMGWLGQVGQADKGRLNYPYYTAREFSRIWALETAYLTSGRGCAPWLRSLHTHSANSSIDQAIDYCEVYTKAGWITATGYRALNDAGIITAFNGRPVQLVLLSSADVGNNWLLHNLINALGMA